MSNVIDLVEVFKAFKNDREKQEFLETQFNVMLELQKKITTLEEENSHLKELLMENVPSLNLALPIIISPEEYLIDAQITILQNRGQKNVELTLEEVKKLDLLLKNKNVIKERKNSNTINVKPSKNNLSKKELVALATTKDNKNE